MSLYTWLNGNGYIDDCPPAKYRSRHEMDLSNPQCGINWGNAYEGATFITWQVDVDDSMLREAYRAEIEATIKRLLEDATEEQVRLVTAEVLAHLDTTLDATIEEKVNSAFATLGILTEEDVDEITSHI